MRDRLHRHELGGDGLRLQVDRFDVAEKHLDVLLLAQHQAGGRCDFSLGQNSGRHLVEQRLKQVAGGLGDQGDVDVGPFEILGRRQTAEAGPDDDDVVAFAGLQRLGHRITPHFDGERTITRLDCGYGGVRAGVGFGSAAPPCGPGVPDAGGRRRRCGGESGSLRLVRNRPRGVHGSACGRLRLRAGP